MKAIARLQSMLEVLDNRHRRRRLAPRLGLDFASNDYLGLAEGPLLKQVAKDALARDVPLGAGGSRLLRGNHPEHEALEEEAAAFFGSEAALFMGGGFQANHAIFSALPAAGDLILYDDLVHASAHEGMRTGRAETRAFVHNDPKSAAQALQTWRDGGGKGQVWIAIESVYSMEGDIAPVAEFSRLAKRENAILVVDEAHATGVWGASGAGIAAAHGSHVLTLHTCGKGLGVSGGLICGDRILIEALINRARPFIFATAPAPFNAALVRGALRILRENPELQTEAKARIQHAHAEARRLGLQNATLESQIIPIVFGDDETTMHNALALQEVGFDVRGIRPPTVPRNTSRLRVSITGNVSMQDISALFVAIAEQQRDAA